MICEIKTAVYFNRREFIKIYANLYKEENIKDGRKESFF